MRKEPPEIKTRPSSVAVSSFWKLGGLSSWRLGRTVFEQIIANNVFGRAAELAFYFLFALFPLMFFVMTLFGLFASNSVELQNDLLSFFADLLPPAAFRLLARVATEVAAHASQGKLTFGLVSALWYMTQLAGSQFICKAIRRARPSSRIGFSTQNGQFTVSFLSHDRCHLENSNNPAEKISRVLARCSPAEAYQSPD